MARSGARVVAVDPVDGADRCSRVPMAATSLVAPSWAEAQYSITREPITTADLTWGLVVERVTGIEPALSAGEALLASQKHWLAMVLGLTTLLRGLKHGSWRTPGITGRRLWGSARSAGAPERVTETLSRVVTPRIADRRSPGSDER
jgi:hypothetical protein